MKIRPLAGVLGIVAILFFMVPGAAAQFASAI